MTTAVRRRRRSRRDSRRHNRIALGLLAGVCFGWAMMWLAREIARHQAVSLLVLAGLLALTGATAGLVLHRRNARELRRVRRSISLAEFDAMDDRQFEFALRDLVIRDGGTRVERVGGANDLGADVKALLPGRWWRRRSRKVVIQAKRYQLSNHVSSGDCQKVGGTWKTIHGARMAIVVTNSTFTRSAAKYCRDAGIRMCDRQQLAAWASKTGPAPWEGRG